MIFRWKFVVIGLGVILLVLVGICSELIKQLSQRKQIPINTTFLSTLLSRSQILTQSSQSSPSVLTLKYLISGLRNAYDIKYDNTTQLFHGYHTSGESISKQIKQHQNLLILLKLAQDINGTEVQHKFGMYLHAYFPDIDYRNNNTDTHVTNTTDDKDQMKSIMFSLQANNHIKLDKSQQCFIYQYDNMKKILTFAQLIHLDENTASSEVRVNIDNYNCFNKNGINERDKVIEDVRSVIGFSLEPNEESSMKLVLKRMEIYELRMTYGDVEEIIYRISNGVNDEERESMHRPQRIYKSEQLVSRLKKLKMR